ncbi:HlyD family efflux transporter periplasmic adaptor subunit [Rudaea sp.]|uniref:HlyD family secretion protein n=1 Tax=Rudaea sp. TaxID=2136325 RepID=UPI0032209F81
MNLHFVSRHPRLIPGLGLGLCALAVAAALPFAGKRKPDDVSILRRNLETVLVQQGDLVVPVSAAGIFVEKEKKLLASPSSGTIEEILVAPGTMAKKNEVVFRLSNSRLAEQAQASRVALEKANLDLKEAVLSEKIEAMAQSSRQKELERQFAIEARERDALRPLMERGIVSKLDMARADAKVGGLRSQISEQADRVALAHDLGASRIAIKEEALKQARDGLALAQQKLDELAIRSTVDGPVQDVFVELGQAVSPGEKLALVSSSNDLIAALKIPQAKAASIAHGNKATLYVQGKTVHGTVVRIDPKVRDDSVQVDVAPDEPLPFGVRAAESLAGDVEGAPTSEAVYVERADDIQPFKERDIYLLSGNELRRHRIQFGAPSGKYVEIRSGARAGDRFAVGLDQALYAKTTLTVAD